MTRLDSAFSFNETSIEGRTPRLPPLNFKEENIMPFVKPSKETTEKLRGWLILNPNKPRRKLDDGPRLPAAPESESEVDPSPPNQQ
jgi:hypothetical protein